MKVAFVVPRYGVEVVGGAERLCRVLAERMARYWHVEAVTTCALDYVTWRDHYPPGTQRMNGVVVHRFPVDGPRDIARFNALSAQLSAGVGTSDTQLQWMREQGPYSSSLLDFLRRRVEEYDWFVYVPYLYSTTYFGLSLTADRSILIPAAHDEPPIALDIFDEVFDRPRALVFSTPEEQAFVNRRFRLRAQLQDVIGVGLDLPLAGSAERFRRAHGELDGCPFLLYAGRVEPAKGCEELFENFARYRAQWPERRLKLVLLGDATMPVPRDANVLYLGFVDEAAKLDAMAAAEVVVVPSPYESLSLVALEAWAAGRPVLANAASAALRGQCARSDGGLWYASYAEFREALSLLLERPQLAGALGRAGQTFVARNYAWPVVEEKYRMLFDRLAVAASRVS